MWKLIYILKLITGVSDLLKRIICTLLLALFSFGFSLNVSATNRYQWITSTDSETISYDTKSVTYYSTNGKVVDVWVLWEFTDEGARKFVESLRFQEAKWDNFSYDLEHYLISKNSQKLLKIVYYDVNGNVIKSSDFSQITKWKSIVPDSIFEAVRDKFTSFLDS